MLNHLQLEARVSERSALRHTPAGIPVVDLMLEHQSEQIESGISRQVSCELRAVAVGEQARWFGDIAAGVIVRVTGFLAARSLKNRSLVLHVTHTEFLEG